jgi:large subunit ribosomal protein L2
MVSKYKIKKSFKFSNEKKIKLFFVPKKKSLGRSNGKIVIRHRGGGVKRQYRLFNHYPKNIPFKILKILRDPNSSSFTNLILTQNGSFFYCKSNYDILPSNVIFNSFSKNLAIGTNLPLKNIPRNVPISNIENLPRKGPIFCRAAGTFGKIIGKNTKYALVKLTSGEFRYININSQAKIGVNSNSDNYLFKKYKAGQNRLLNKRPRVRGVAMNPVDHPHGGGEGKTSGGRPSVSK